jgi:hypothetical protein
MGTIRELLLECFPSARGPLEPDVELADALYCLLRTNDVGVTVDGWEYIRITRESRDALEAVGLVWLLPSGSVPIAVHVEANASGLAWKAQVGREDEEWRAQSESKRWKSVYLYATGDRSEPGWSWDEYQGTVRQPDA